MQSDSVKFRNYLIWIIRLSLFLLLLHLVRISAYAVTLTYSNIPTSIGKDPFTIQVTVDGANSGTNYLRIDLYKEGSTNYFGETYNGSSWYKGSEGLQYLPITIGDSKIATASVQGKVGEPTVSEYSGPGQYKLRVRRYTSSGNAVSGDNQTPTTFEITVPLNSPSPTPESNPTPNPTPDIIPSPRATLRPTPVVRTSTRPSPRRANASPSVEPEILGENSQNLDPSPSLFPSISPKPGSVAAPVGIMLMFGGIGLSGIGGYLAYKQIAKKEA